MLSRRRKRQRSRASNGLFFYQMVVGVCLALGIFFLMAVVWYGTRLESLTITKVEVSGGETIDHAFVRSLVEEELKGEYYRLVPKRFSWTYPENRILRQVKDVPRVKSVTVLDSDADTISLTLEEYRPFALWCHAGNPEIAKDPCAFIDENGYAFVMAPPLVGSSFMRYINGNDPKIGDSPFNTKFLSDTSFMTEELSKRFGWVVVAIERVGLDEGVIHLRGGGVLKFTMRQEAGDTLDNLGVILSSQEFPDLNPEKFSYIDLRFGDRVFINEDGALEDNEVAATSTPEAAD